MIDKSLGVGTSDCPSTASLLRRTEPRLEVQGKAAQVPVGFGRMSLTIGQEVAPG